MVTYLEATPKQRRQAGRDARDVAPRGGLGPWNPDRRSQDALEVILAQDATRTQWMIPIRHARMALTPWTYFRGAAGVMASDLASAPHSGITVQLCGDAHVLNFGLWATPERNLAFDLRDFDETLPGPFEWDLQRLLCSIVVLCRDNKLPASTASAALSTALGSYQDRIADFAEAPELTVWYDRVDVGDLLSLMQEEGRTRMDLFIQKQARKRTSAGALERLTEIRDGIRRITIDPPFRVPIEDPHQAESAQEVLETYQASLPQQMTHLVNRFHFVDSVRQIVGVGSVGVQVYLVLLNGRHGDDDPLFLQVKEAVPSVYEQYLGPSGFANHGERVIRGRWLVQAASDIFTGWSTAGGTSFYVRQFRDMKVIPDSRQIAPDIVRFSGACARVLAHAHARTGDAAQIAGYIGKGGTFAKAMTAFAHSYADQTATDHRQLKDAIDRGRISSSMVY